MISYDRARICNPRLLFYYNNFYFIYLTHSNSLTITNQNLMKLKLLFVLLFLHPIIGTKLSIWKNWISAEALTSLFHYFCPLILLKITKLKLLWKRSLSYSVFFLWGFLILFMHKPINAFPEIARMVLAF